MYLDHNDISKIPDYPAEELSAAEILREARLEYLPVALELMKINYPFEYQLISDYYLSEKTVTMLFLAQKYSITQKKVEYRINKAKRLIREYIIAHENGE
jgi:AraC-like DNA-binding protein